ncbi:MAG: Hsp20/alpha crystallin family protein [Anaerolineae bacterium]
MTKAKDDRRRRTKEQGKQEEKQEAGVATGVLKGLGNLIPGLEHVVDALEKSEPFRERLKEIDEEVECRLREGGPRPTRPGSRVRSIPPRHRGGTATRGARPKAGRPPRRPIRVDVLEEGKNVRVIAEMPGLTENDIHVELKGDRLVLAAESPRGLQFGEFVLPRPCAGILEQHYRNGVLDLLLDGEGEE